MMQPNVPEVKIEHKILSSQYINGERMYPHVCRFTWIKSKHMPWILLSIDKEIDPRS